MRSRLSLISILLILFYSTGKTQVPDPALIGYWHNWNDASAPYIQLDQVDARYNIINLSFAIPQFGTDYKMEFIPDQVSQSVLISQIQNLQTSNKKVLISIGGAASPVSLDNAAERDTFISSMNSIINTYGFDGIDIDLEGGSLSITGGTIASPVDSPIINMIFAIKKIMQDYYSLHSKRLILTFAPETAFVQGGISSFGGIWGAYLPLLDALRDSLEILHVQLYNSGSMTGIDGLNYSQGTADFIVAMTEDVIHGFQTSGGYFTGLPAYKIAIGLPACNSAAGGGFTDTATVQAAVNYLRGVNSTPPGSYILSQSGGYPDLRGMMTWSINWDAVNTCQNSYQYAGNYITLFGSVNTISNQSNENFDFNFYPNPSADYIFFKTEKLIETNTDIEILNSIGSLVSTISITDNFQRINISDLPAGIYFIKFLNSYKRLIKL